MTAGLPNPFCDNPDPSQMQATAGEELSASPSTSGVDTHADLPPLPSGSINAGRAPLEAGDLADTLRDKISLCFFLVVLVSVAALGGALGAVLSAWIG